MPLTRRILLAGLAASLAGCGSGSDAAGDTTELWIWPGGLGDAVTQDAVARYARRTRLLPNVVQGDYLDTLTAALGSGDGVPAIAGIKGEDIAAVLPRAEDFVDLNTLGARDLAGQFLPWKLAQGSTADGQQIGLPIDIGPTAMFYRSDLLRRAGLEAGAMPTWERFLEAGTTFRRRNPGVHWLRNAPELFTTAVGQEARRFVDEGNHFVGDQAHVRDAWNLAVELVERGLSANIPPGHGDEWDAAVRDGKLAIELGAAWHAADLQEAAPDSAGSWRVAAGPAAGANSGGSFLAIPAAGGAPELAFEIISWLLTPENEARNFTDAALFPATPAAYKMNALTRPDPFFGGQVTVEVFAASAEKIKRVYEAPADAALAEVYLTQLAAVDAGEKKGDAAWASAVATARQLATEQGVN
ncbi:ABC transporter substrate-binding protein [Symbioplanes lichenis]|uniref:ABC transporter substrate-binding protein n=1 Tax=Symbioplanes lichenis TaxID=1629072 RepID=UPI00273A4E6A|nr:extracellular solute-binding protein [Actinoplanes lichenis]